MISQEEADLAAGVVSRTLASAAGNDTQASLVALILSGVILLLLLCSLPWRRLRLPLPMPWDIFRSISFGRLRVVRPEAYELDDPTLEVTELKPKQFGTVSRDDVTIPLQELLQWVADHPFTGYKGGIARLVGKLLWLEHDNPDLYSEIHGFNDIDIIYFLQEGEETKKKEMQESIDAGFSIGGIPVEAADVEYSHDTIPQVLATRDLTQNQCLIVSDGQGKVFLVNAKICHEHFVQGKSGPAVTADNSTLDDQGNVIASARMIGRAMIQWMKGRARTVELSDATIKFYQQQKLPKMTQFQIFSKAKGNEMYMKIYTELIRLGFLERQQFPHVLWGECYAHVNSLIARNGYRLELEGEFNSEAVERWKEGKYAEQLSRSRVSVWRDFRWHQKVLDASFEMRYFVPHTDLTHGLHSHQAARDGGPEHRSRQHLGFLRQQGAEETAINISSRGTFRTRAPGFENAAPGLTIQLGGSESPSSRERLLRQSAYATSKEQTQKTIQLIRTRGGAGTYVETELPEDQQDPLLNQTLFGKLTVTETVLHIYALAKPAWRLLVTAFLLNCLATMLYIFVIHHFLGMLWLLVAAAVSMAGCVIFLNAANQIVLHALTSMFLALLNMQVDAFGSRMFSEIWGRLTGDTKSLQSVLQACNDLTIEILTFAGCVIAVLGISATGGPCDSKPVLHALFAGISSSALMAAMSLLAGLALRQRSRSSRSMIGFLYYNMFSTLSRYFEIKSMPELWAGSHAAFQESQRATLEERKKLSIVEQLAHTFLRYTELACTTLVLSTLLQSVTSPGCGRQYAVQGVAMSMALASMRRACESILHLSSSMGSLERLFLLGRSLLRVATARFDGLNTLGMGVTLEIPQQFTYCVGSPQFGPFACVPALAPVTQGQLNTVSMPRGSGATTLAKILLRMTIAAARVKLNGVHIEQYEQEMLSFKIHILDHTPFPSSTATSAGQGQSLADYVQIGGLADEGASLVQCLEQAGVWDQVGKIPNGIESTDWALNMSKPQSYLIQLAQAIFRVSLGAVRILVVIDPLRDCSAVEEETFREKWKAALRPLLTKVLVLLIDQSGDVKKWSS